jgi:starch synthase
MEYGKRMAEQALKICMASSELTPLAKTGGLADVTAALAGYLDQLGHDVRLLIPFTQALIPRAIRRQSISCRA